MSNGQDGEVLALTSQIVAGYVSRNSVQVGDLPGLILSVHAALKAAGSPVAVEPAAEPLKPAVPIKKSVSDDYIICLEDGKKLKMLKRHLRTAYDMSPGEYRAKWGLPNDYPMVAPAYAKARSNLAISLGLGKRTELEVAENNGTGKVGRPRGKKAE